MKKSGASANNHGVGRRKSSVARVWLKKGNGSILVNGKDFNTYFPTKVAQNKVVLPFRAANMEKDFDVNVNVFGGGTYGQADAIKLGISRALLEFDDNLRGTLKKYGLLTVDARLKERKKYGQRGARRKFQFVKR